MSNPMIDWIRTQLELVSVAEMLTMWPFYRWHNFSFCVRKLSIIQFIESTSSSRSKGRGLCTLSPRNPINFLVIKGLNHSERLKARKFPPADESCKHQLSCSSFWLCMTSYIANWKEFPVFLLTTLIYILTLSTFGKKEKAVSVSSYLKTKT